MRDMVDATTIEIGDFLKFKKIIHVDQIHGRY